MYIRVSFDLVRKIGDLARAADCYNESQPAVYSFE